MKLRARANFPSRDRGGSTVTPCKAVGSACGGAARTDWPAPGVTSAAATPAPARTAFQRARRRLPRIMSRRSRGLSACVLALTLQLVERNHDVLPIGRTGLQPGIPRRDVRQRWSFDVQFEVAVEGRAGGNIGQRRPIAAQEGPARQGRVENAELRRGLGQAGADRRPVSLCFGGAVVAPEDAAEESGLQGGLGPVHPAVDRGPGRWIVGPKRSLAVARREVAEDGVRLPHRQVAVLQHGNPAMRVQRPERRRVEAAVVAAGGDLLEGEAELAGEPQHLLDIERAATAPDSEHACPSTAGPHETTREEVGSISGRPRTTANVPASEDADGDVRAPRRRLALPPRVAPRLHAQAQGVELDEAGGVAVVVGALALLEGDEVLVVERARAGAADDRDVALVELDPHPAGDLRL